MLYFSRAKIVNPYNKNSIKTIINKMDIYSKIRNNLTIHEQHIYISTIMKIIMFEPELLSLFPKLRKVFKEKYYILKKNKNNNSKIIKDIPRFLLILKQRSDYVVEKGLHNYNLRLKN